jgi:glycosyltransferase involved in cell wall biosynthesis
LAALREADAAVVYSDCIRRHLSENGVNRLHVVPSFVEPPTDLVSLPTARRVFFLGRLVPYKGVDVLIRALKRVPDATLEICGDGWSGPSLRRHVSRAGMQDQVSFLGYQDTSLLREMFDRSACVAVPSLWPEPFGQVGIEAMARARPVIASDTGGIREWLRDRETGYLVRPGDEVALASAIDRMFANYTEASEMGRRGAEVVETCFSPAAFVAKTLPVYHSAIDAWRGRASQPS